MTPVGRSELFQATAINHQSQNQESPPLALSQFWQSGANPDRHTSPSNLGEQVDCYIC